MHEGLGKKSKWLWEAAKHLQNIPASGEGSSELAHYMILNAYA
jgi:hypothetical protein